MAASWLVRELIARFGAASFRRLYATARDTRDPAEVDRALQAVYGVGLEHAWERASPWPRSWVIRRLEGGPSRRRRTTLFELRRAAA